MQRPLKDNCNILRNMLVQFFSWDFIEKTDDLFILLSMKQRKQNLPSSMSILVNTLYLI